MARDLKDFLNNADELHALVIGMGEVIAPWPARYKIVDAEPYANLSKEHHYYQLGRIFGMFVWLGFIAILKVIFS